MDRRFAPKRDLRPEPEPMDINGRPLSAFQAERAAREYQEQLPAAKKARLEDLRPPTMSSKCNHVGAKYAEKFDERWREYEKGLLIRAPHSSPEYRALGSTAPVVEEGNLLDYEVQYLREHKEVIPRSTLGGIPKPKVDKDHAYYVQQKAAVAARQAGLNWQQRVGQEFMHYLARLHGEQVPPSENLDPATVSAVRSLYYGQIARYLVHGYDVCRNESAVCGLEKNVLAMEDKAIRLHAMNLKRRMWDNAKEFLAQGLHWPWLHNESPQRHATETLEGYFFRAWQMDIWDVHEEETTTEEVSLATGEEEQEEEECQEKEPSNACDSPGVRAHDADPEAPMAETQALGA